jgi:hypothetical protein
VPEKRFRIETGILGGKKTPSGRSEKQATTEIKELSAGEEARYTAEFTPKETGGYTVYVYLYDGWQRIGYKTSSIYVQRQ